MAEDGELIFDGYIVEMVPGGSGAQKVVAIPEDQHGKDDARRKTFRCWQFEYQSDEVSDTWIVLEASQQKDLPVRIWYYEDEYTGKYGKTKSNKVAGATLKKDLDSGGGDAPKGTSSPAATSPPSVSPTPIRKGSMLEVPVETLAGIKGALEYALHTIHEWEEAAMGNRGPQTPQEEETEQSDWGQPAPVTVPTGGF